MDIGIGLPAGVPGVAAHDVLAWAQSAEAHGFSSVASFDRLVYGNWEPLIALAAAAAVTERVRLVTTVLNVPPRGNPALLAKQAATVQQLSGGRLTLGLGLGGRRDDYAAAGVPADAPGRLMDEALAELDAIWSGAPRGLAGAIGPTPDVRPELLMGGFSAGAHRRAARYGDGWMAAGPPPAFIAGAERTRQAWRDAGRTDAPRLTTIAFFSLGADAEGHARRRLLDYYAFAGRPEQATTGDALAHATPEQVAAGALTSPAAIHAARDAFAEAGCDELILLPTQADLGQVALLAQVLA